MLEVDSTFMYIRAFDVKPNSLDTRGAQSLDPIKLIFNVSRFCYTKSIVS